MLPGRDSHAEAAGTEAAEGETRGAALNSARLTAY